MVSISPTHNDPQPESGAGSRPRRHRVRRQAVSGTAIGASVLLAGALVGQAPAYAADAPVGLGTAAAYSVLGGTTVTNTGPTELAGELGVSAGSAITGFPLATQPGPPMQATRRPGWPSLI